MYEETNDYFTQQDIDILEADFERHLAETEAEMAELDANAPTPAEFESEMNEYLASLEDDSESPTDAELKRFIADYERHLAEKEAEMADLDANAPTQAEFESDMDECLASLEDAPELPTDAEIEAILSTPEYHRETIEYVTHTHSSKEEALSNKKNADGYWRKSDNDPLFAMHDVTVYELMELHKKGMSFRWLPLECKYASPGRCMVMVDIDNGKPDDPWHPNITVDELKDMLSNLGFALWSTSTSGKPYKYHILFFMDKKVYTEAEYTEAHEEYERKLSNEFRRVRRIPEGEGIPMLNGILPRLTDPKCKSWNNLFYGVCQEKSEKLLLNHNEYRDGIIPYTVPDEQHLEITIDRLHKELPKPCESRMPYTFEEWTQRTVPTSTSGLIHVLNERGLTDSTTIKVDYAFRAYLPYNNRKGASKSSACVKEGNRFNCINAFALKMYAVWRSCNLYLGQHGYEKFSSDDLLQSFTGYVNKAFDSTWDFDTRKALCTIHGLIDKFKDASDKDYCDKYKRYACKRGRLKNLLEDDRPLQTLLRSPDHCACMSKTLLERYGRNFVATFESRQVLLAILKEMGVSETTFKRYALIEGYSIKYTKVSKVGRPSGTQSAASAESVMSKGSVVDGVFQYVGSITSAERMWLRRHDIKKTKKIKKGKL
jgi:Uri superfamily endonuclease